MSILASFRIVLCSLGIKKMEHPIFYNNKVAIRFNIGDNGNDAHIEDGNNEFVNPEYISACLKRSLKIYYSLPSTPDILVIEGFLYEDETIEDFILSVLNTTQLPQPNEITTEEISDIENKYIHLYLFWELKDFDPNILLKEIIKTELGNGNNILSSSVYFVCTNDNVIFHLYDDRGADLVADKKERIINIYYNLNDLILDYDREKIDYIFKQKSS